MCSWIRNHGNHRICNQTHFLNDKQHFAKLINNKLSKLKYISFNIL